MPDSQPWQPPLTHLGDMPVKKFLAEYWQQRPLVVRQAFPDFHSPVSANELAGFALEDSVDSRLIRETPAADPLTSDWKVDSGPLPETAFSRLPASHWTLLVQAVDQLVPAVARLLNPFRFLPNWRLDDLMVSYAADKGSVGPHFDYYDVFLLQAEGERVWRLGQMCDQSSPLRRDLPLNLLADFKLDEEHLLKPGDMLYLPPGLAHWGIAQGPCMTFSIGFRAPSHEDLLLDYCAEIAADLPAHQRYTDARTVPQTQPGEITPEAVEWVQAILEGLTRDPQRIGQWLGRYGTRSTRDLPELEDAPFPDAHRRSKQVMLKPQVRAAYLHGPAGSARLFLDGDEFQSELPLAQSLTAYRPIATGDIRREQDRQLLEELLRRQWLFDIQEDS